MGQNMRATLTENEVNLGLEWDLIVKQDQQKSACVIKQNQKRPKY
jgi:hypothetical protein